ncbi:MAG: NADH:ubiquinone reductase (Na(+)-transporting) subunit A, partial [Planctomycetaceae bacterium]|nr:NADH:ubiquinone reductase (Na(+)-transporting) subunit A [Planctomycetaceae bacterium]
MYRITKGLDLPITGQPEQKILPGPACTRAALSSVDYNGMKPTMLVQEGDSVKVGQALFADKKAEGVVYTSPAAGRVAAINRGERRAFQTIEIEVQGTESVQLKALAERDFSQASRAAVTEVLAESGLWTSFRTRPFSKVPGVGSVPRSIFVQAIDTNPLSVDPRMVIHEREQDFQFGLQALTKLTDGKVFLCRRPGTPL